MSLGALRIGILLDSYDQPAWLYAAVEKIAASASAEICAVVFLDTVSRKAENDKLIPRLYLAIDEKVFVRRNNARDILNLEALLKTVPTIRIRPVHGEKGLSIDSEIAARVQECRLDILVNVCTGEIPTGLAKGAKYGVWEYFCEREPHGFWEALEGRTGTSMYLRAWGAPGRKDTLLFGAASCTYPFSPARNGNRSLWKAASYLPRQIERLQVLGEERYYEGVKRWNAENGPTPKVEIKDPSVLRQLWLVLRMPFRNIGETVSRKLNRDAWYLLFDADGDRNRPLQEYKKIIPPKGRFWADPQVVCQGDDHYIFIEDFEARTARGRISVLKVDQNGECGEAAPVLVKDYHLSYPCVFEWEDKYYMVPESGEHRTIDLYEAVAFPHQWVHRTTLMDHVNAVDSTLLHYRGKWWLFTGISENKGSAPEVELFLFYTDDLFSGRWMPHPLNPLLSDAKNARPAGAIFIRQGKLFRPSQDCSEGYGHGFDLNEIVTLTQTEYAERRIASVRPDWDKKVTGTHTYGEADRFKIIDAYTTRSRILEVWRP